MDTKLMRQLIYGFLLLFVLGIVKSVDAQQVLNVAVAANFAPALEQISKRFTVETGIPVQLTISSSGRLFAQIKHRAPFDLYFSADTKRPEMLHEAGLCNEATLYARGKSVLWSKDEKLCALENWREVVNNAAVKYVAIANPETAPYGTVARDACIHLDSWPEIEKKFVYGNNVGQAFQYAEAGVVDAAFIAQSLALTEKAKVGCFWDIPESTPVEQKACTMGYSRSNKMADNLLTFATSNKTADIRTNFGYR